ncbi:FAD-dependent oxidoreductase [Chenggangzhangella methanolivorans]|uniref:FAD-dependent oxidoreductase n=1 Tax=Chenggangzhangella methanolivorans TaxID=1437009 RepID=A0A9E6R928_9HYPH|nr:FAD-dependent oxidoreductase [Chenggangzhangella methanolivorans]QZN98872.1 FAD-dependent oxidoreductase [Chenggangzhangella methanolivorans]
MDIHHPDTGQAYFVDVGGDGAFDVPYRSLLPQGIDNLIVAGRCLSATHFAHGATRNMAPCIVTGQAAGTAAALAARGNAPVAHLDVADLQKRLVADNAFLGETTETRQRRTA